MLWTNAQTLTSHPSRVRELKLLQDVEKVCRYLSHPSRVRELKQKHGLTIGTEA